MRRGTTKSRDDGADHPTDRWLLDAAEAVGDGPRVRAAREHLDTGCERCVSRRDALAAIVARVAAGPLPAPPTAVLRRARRLFRHAAIAGVAERAFEWIGSLVLDRRMEPVPALRAAPGSVRHLLWRFGENELFVTLSASGTHWLLQGQVLPEEEAEVVRGAVVLINNTGPVGAAELDDEGYFAIRDLSPARYRIEGELGGLSFRVPSFEVEAWGPPATR